MGLVWIIVALVVGLLAGALSTYAFMRHRYGDGESVAELRDELEQYRSKVTEHFVETADLVNTLTRNYKNVYDHLEKGAYELVGEETLRKRLDTVDEAPVMIEYLGQRRSASRMPPSGAPTAESAPGSPKRSSTESSAQSPARSTAKSSIESTGPDSESKSGSDSESAPDSEREPNSEHADTQAIGAHGDTAPTEESARVDDERRDTGTETGARSAS